MRFFRILKICKLRVSHKDDDKKVVAMEEHNKKEIIKKIQEISSLKVDNFNEENVKFHIVTKLLNVLGHEDNIDLEYSFGRDRPDVVIKGPKQPIIIEVKGANENLNLHISQIRKYSYNLDSCLSILTNGKLFYFFSPFWRQPTFEERLILSFSLKELQNEDIIKKVISLLHRDLILEIDKNLMKIEDEVLKLKEKINENQVKISELEDKKKRIVEKYPEIKLLIEHINYLDSTVKSDIKAYLDIEKQIKKLKEETQILRNQIPSLIQTPTASTPSRKETEKKSIILPSQSEDFSMGIADEIINFIALTQGKQIILCKKRKSPNDCIFLIPKKRVSKVDFVPSEIGRKLMKIDIDVDVTKYVAKVDYIPNIPGDNREFWEEIYSEGEFNLWDIDGGPMKYFSKSKRDNMLFWVFRVYEMPFKIKEGVDFVRLGRQPKIVNPETLKRIQSGFNNGEFKPVLSDDEFEKKKKKIEKIVRKYG